MRRGGGNSNGLDPGDRGSFQEELRKYAENSGYFYPLDNGWKDHIGIAGHLETDFPHQLCLSETARLSIILATPQLQPWYRLPVSQVLNRRRKTIVFSASGCLNNDLHFEIPRSTE